MEQYKKTRSLGKDGQKGVWVKASPGGGEIRGRTSTSKSGKRPRAGPQEKSQDPDSDALLLVQLGGSKRVKVYKYKGVGAFLDIREMYSKDGLEYKLPGKKGVTLSIEAARVLLQNKDKLLKALESAENEVKEEKGPLKEKSELISGTSSEVESE